jgi:hypothetical protein
MTTDKIHSIAIKGMVSAFEKSLELEPTQLPEPGVYNFDSEGWAVFGKVDGYQIGATEYCAVNLTTGEFRYLGRIGE